MSALESLDAPRKQTTRDGFAETIRTRVGDPAVGVALDGTGVSLATPPVEPPGVDFDEETPLSELDGRDREFHLVLIDSGRTVTGEDDDLLERPTTHPVQFVPRACFRRDRNTSVEL